MITCDKTVEDQNIKAHKATFVNCNLIDCSLSVDNVTLINCEIMGSEIYSSSVRIISSVLKRDAYIKMFNVFTDNLTIIDSIVMYTKFVNFFNCSNMIFVSNMVDQIDMTDFNMPTNVEIRDNAGICMLDINDPRGYRPIAYRYSRYMSKAKCSRWHIKSGCRDMTIAAALKHWGSDDYAPMVNKRWKLDVVKLKESYVNGITRFQKSKKKLV